MEFWIDFLGKLAVAGGLFWFILDKAVQAQLKKLDLRLAKEKADYEIELKKQLSQYETERRLEQANHEAQLKIIQAQLDANLSALNHARNTVFSRYDEKRAEAILKLNGAISRFTRLSIEIGFPVLGDEAPALQCLNKGYALNSVANEVIGIIGENLFFFTNDLKAPAALWHNHAAQFCRVAAEVAFQLSQDESFSKKSRGEQQRIIRTSIESETKKISDGLSILKNKITDILEQSFRDSSPLQNSVSNKNA